MTKEEVIQIIENNPYTYLKQIFIYRRDKQFDMAVLYIQKEVGCNEEIAQQSALHYFERQTSQYKSIKCPYCQSTNTKKLDVIDRGVSFGIFGFASGKISKQWHCNSCRSDF